MLMMNSGEFGFSRNCSEREKGEAETIIKVRRCWIISALYKKVRLSTHEAIKAAFDRAVAKASCVPGLRSKCTWIVLQNTQNGRTFP